MKSFKKNCNLCMEENLLILKNIRDEKVAFISRIEKYAVSGSKDCIVQQF